MKFHIHSKYISQPDRMDVLINYLCARKKYFHTHTYTQEYEII